MGGPNWDAILSSNLRAFFEKLSAAHCALNRANTVFYLQLEKINNIYVNVTEQYLLFYFSSARHGT